MFEELLRQAGLSLAQVGGLLRALAVNPWVRSADATAVVPTGATTVDVIHGLQRTFNGAAVVGQTDASVRVSTDLPGAAAERLVTVRLSAAVAYPFTVKLRIY